MVKNTGNHGIPILEGSFSCGKKNIWREKKCFKFCAAVDVKKCLNTNQIICFSPHVCTMF